MIVSVDFGLWIYAKWFLLMRSWCNAVWTSLQGLIWLALWARSSEGKMHKGLLLIILGSEFIGG